MSTPEPSPGVPGVAPISSTSAPTPTSAAPAHSNAPLANSHDLAAYLARIAAVSNPGYTNQLFAHGGSFQQMQHAVGPPGAEAVQLPNQQLIDVLTHAQQSGTISETDGVAALAAIAAQALPSHGNQISEEAWRQMQQQQQQHHQHQQHQQQQQQQHQQLQQQVPMFLGKNEREISGSAAASPVQGGEGDITDQRELKRIRRKQSNRESARRSRQKKQAECEVLATKVNRLEADNIGLKQENLQLRAKLDVLINQLQSQGTKFEEPKIENVMPTLMQPQLHHHQQQHVQQHLEHHAQQHMPQGAQQPALSMAQC